MTPDSGEIRREQDGYRPGWFTSQDGLRLFYRDYGDEVLPEIPVLCLPGLSRNSRDFHAVAMRLAPHRRVVCLDYRGRGLSQYAPEWRQYAAQNDLNDVRHLMAVTGLERVIVIGTSYGGLLTMGLGVVVPRAIAGVVLNDIGPEQSSGGQSRILELLAEGRPQPGWAEAITHLKDRLPHLHFPNEDAWHEFARGSYVEHDSGELRVNWDTNIVRPLQPGGGDAPDLWALFRSLVGVPVLLLRGEHTDLLSEATAARMAEMHPQLMRVEVADAGHTPMLSEPESLRGMDALFEAVARAEAVRGDGARGDRAGGR